MSSRTPSSGRSNPVKGPTCKPIVSPRSLENIDNSVIVKTLEAISKLYVKNLGVSESPVIESKGSIKYHYVIIVVPVKKMYTMNYFRLKDSKSNYDFDKEREAPKGFHLIYALGVSAVVAICQTIHEVPVLLFYNGCDPSDMQIEMNDTILGAFYLRPGKIGMYEETSAESRLESLEAGQKKILEQLEEMNKIFLNIMLSIAEVGQKVDSLLLSQRTDYEKSILEVNSQPPKAEFSKEEENIMI